MKRRVASTALVALALLTGTAVASPAAQFRHAEARFGSWRATLVTNVDNGRTVVRVWHRGRLMLARQVLAAVDFPGAGDPRGFACCGTPITFEFLDGPDPQLVMSLYTGGKYCCTLTRLVDFNGSRPRIVTVDDDCCAELRRFARRPVFVGVDVRFEYVFPAPAEDLLRDTLPLRIWRYTHGVLHDVTRSYTPLVAEHAASLSDFAAQVGHGGNEVRGMWAAWAADEALLGRARFARVTLERLADEGRLTGRDSTEPEGRAYVAKLWRFLAAKGYL